jgi:hypothetical protein
MSLPSTAAASSYKMSAASRSNSPVPPFTNNSPPIISQGAKDLQERLHLLLNRLAKTTDLIKNWPESDGGDDASIHVETTTKLIASIHELVTALQKVEGTIKTNTELKQTLRDCPVPINLLDLLDHHPDGLNPECFSRGLLREALGQLGGLKRRKLALEMLGAAVQSGLDRQKNNVGGGDGGERATQSSKRKLEEEKGGGGGAVNEGAAEDGKDSTVEPGSKKARTSTEG